MKSGTSIANTITIGPEEQRANTLILSKKTSGREAVCREPEQVGNQTPWKPQIIWIRIVGFVAIHVAAVYGFYLGLVAAKYATLLWAAFLIVTSGVGVTGGAHRLWCHRSYKAKWPLRVLLALAHTIALQTDLVDWCRNHRIHHKYTETDADPHDARRGFFFAHAGWLLCTEHPDVTRARAAVNLDDVLKDPVAFYQRKYYLPLVVVFCLIMPAWVPWYFWNESFLTGFLVAFVFRYILSLNLSFLVNSLAHTYGSHPYDRSTSPTENTFVALMTVGEGWHNYHHVFPWDYKAGELGSYGTNWTTAFIDFFASIGWAYDLKSVSKKVIRSRVLRTGDGSHPVYRNTQCNQE